MKGSGKTVGALIQRLREQAGLSMGELAEASGIDKASISRIERGEFIKPKEETLTAIAQALGADPADLLNAAGYVSPTTLPRFQDSQHGLDRPRRCKGYPPCAAGVVR